MNEDDPYPTRFITVYEWSDGRKYTGKLVHLFKGCRDIKNKKTIIDIQGSPELVRLFDQCKRCERIKEMWSRELTPEERRTERRAKERDTRRGK